jgi:hypothetical protein
MTSRTEPIIEKYKDKIIEQSLSDEERNFITDPSVENFLKLQLKN